MFWPIPPRLPSPRTGFAPTLGCTHPHTPTFSLTYAPLSWALGSFMGSHSTSGTLAHDTDPTCLHSCLPWWTPWSSRAASWVLCSSRFQTLHIYLEASIRFDGIVKTKETPCRGLCLRPSRRFDMISLITEVLGLRMKITIIHNTHKCGGS